MGLQSHWSLSPGSNQQADPQINYREGQAPSSLNDAGRQVMAMVRAFVDDTSGFLVTAGTDTAYALLANENFSALVDGMVLAFRPHTTNTGAATLAVNGLAAKSITVATGVAVSAGQLPSGRVCRVLYRAGPDDFLLDGGGVMNAPVGTRLTFNQATAPAGWVQETNPAYNDAALRIVTGAGGGGGGTTGFTAVFAAALRPHVEALPQAAELVRAVAEGRASLWCVYDSTEERFFDCRGVAVVAVVLDAVRAVAATNGFLARGPGFLQMTVMSEAHRCGCPRVVIELPADLPRWAYQTADKLGCFRPPLDGLEDEIGRA